MVWCRRLVESRGSLVESIYGDSLCLNVYDDLWFNRITGSGIFSAEKNENFSMNWIVLIVLIELKIFYFENRDKNIKGILKTFLNIKNILKEILILKK